MKQQDEYLKVKEQIRQNMHTKQKGTNKYLQMSKLKCSCLQWELDQAAANKITYLTFRFCEY